MIHRLFRYSIYIVILAVVVTSLVVGNTKPARAVTSSDWNAGSIIDDSLFYDNTTMSITDIQNFLNSKVSTCDTQGTQQNSTNPSMTNAQYATSQSWPGPPYVCLKDYIQAPQSTSVVDNYTTSLTKIADSDADATCIFSGTKTAPAGQGCSSAQIIKAAADAYSISPKAILVTLHKESLNLIYDTWPLQSQYKNAMGYGCPDTAPCSASYAGFYNQVNNAAWQFSQYRKNPTSYRIQPSQSATVYYNPSNTTNPTPAPGVCGASNVYIQTYATAGLYNYTPYQPNQAALNNLYGSGDSCSSYGNRNFWRIYNDWFGPTKYQAGIVPSASTNYAKAACTIPDYTTVSVGRLYNPDSQDYLYTTKKDEACAAVKLGYIWDGIALQNPGNQTGTIPVYRLRLGSAHTYTTNQTDRTTMIQNGYIDEGVVTYGYSSSAANLLPVYLLGHYNTRLFTSAGDEGTYLTSSLGYQSFGIGFYTPSTSSTTPLYRLRSGSDKLYTTSTSEVSSATSQYNYSSESNTLTVETAPDQYSRPVYRLNGPSGRLYTTSRVERDLAVINYGYNSEGIGFYSYSPNLSGVQPVYRSTNNQLKSRLYTQYLGESNNSRTYYGYKTEDVSRYGL